MTKKFRFIFTIYDIEIYMNRLSILKKSILMYAGALTVASIASFLLFTAIAGPMFQSAELSVDRYDINTLDFKGDEITKRCPLSKEEEKRLGFVTLTTDDLNKVPKLKETIDLVEKGLEEVTKNMYILYTDPDTGEPIRYYYWVKDENGCYNNNWNYYSTSLDERGSAFPARTVTLTQSEYNSLKELIYNAYKTQHTQEELKRLAELYKRFHPSDEGINAYPTDTLESQQSTKDYADMSTAYIGFFDAFIKYDDKYYRVSMRTIAK